MMNDDDDAGVMGFSQFSAEIINLITLHFLPERNWFDKFESIQSLKLTLAGFLLQEKQY